MKKNADSHRRDLEFSAGDHVLLSSKHIKLKAVGTGKLLPKFLGPFTILKRIGTLAYQLDLLKDMPRVHPVFHVSLLRSYTPGTTPPPPIPVVIDDEPEWQVERIQNHRDRKIPRRPTRARKNPTYPHKEASVREYLVKWAGFGHESNSWQTAAQCKNCQNLVQQYLAPIRPTEPGTV